MHTTLFRLTPDAAAKFLSNNKSNRPLSKSTISCYVADMLSDNWKLTHQGLLVGRDGVLIDGQHRCHAVVRSGMTIDTLVTFDDALTGPLDVPVDVGTARDKAFILGVSKREAAVAAFVAKRLMGWNKISSAALRPYVDFIADDLGSLTGSTKKNSSQAPVQAAAIVRIKLRREDAAYVRAAYAALVEDDFVFMGKAKIVGSFYKQLAIGSMDGYGLFARAFKAFDPQKQDVRRLLIHEDSDAASDAAGAALKQVWDARK